ncbi:hypothetical protein AAIH38_35210, partial [Pseudomonas aeruginosa]|uniref:DUF7210 family protein n=1 Tax=Pseudomonas aeruginosa TaxID=287 RepID=UPI0031B77CE2
ADSQRVPADPALAQVYSAEKPNHTHAGKPVSQGDEIDVSRAEAEFLLRRQLITKIPAEPKADEKRDK